MTWQDRLPPGIVADQKHGDLYAERLAWEFLGPLLVPVLRDVVLVVAGRRLSELGQDTRLTSIVRTEKENRSAGARSTTHIGFRAIDLGFLAAWRTWEEDLRVEINRTFSTGVRSMPRVAPFDHGTAPHWHLQATRAERSLHIGGAIRF